MMGKFKVGQWVRRTGGTSLSTDAGTHGEGFVGQIERIVHDGYEDDLVFTNGQKGIANMYEPWQPKVGDRVRMVKDGKSTTGAVGKLATLATWDDGTFIQNNEDYLLHIDPPVDYHTVAITKNFTRATIDCFEPLPVAAEAQPAALKIEAGKFYKTRDGRRVGPMEVSGDIAETRCGGKWTTVFVDTGRANYEGEHPDDLVAEWVDEPAVAVAASNDNAAPAKPKFKVGDRVVATKEWYGATVGKTYTVTKVERYNYDGSFWIWLDGIRGDSTDGSFPQSNFELVTTTPAIVALIEDGQPLPSARPFVHPDQAAAERESKRLASIHSGKEFGVYVLTSTAKEERTYDHEWQRLAAKGEKINAIRELRSEHTFLSLRSARDFVEDFLRAA